MTASPQPSVANLTEGQIIEAADRVARRDGIDGLTIRTLCAELGVTAPVIYRRFANKEAILGELLNRILARSVLPDDDTLDWAGCVAQCLLNTHDAVAPYPGLALMMSRRIPLSPAGMQHHTYMRGVMTGAGLNTAERNDVLYVLFTYIWGHLLASHTITDATEMLDVHVRSTAEDRASFLDGLDMIQEGLRTRYGGRHSGGR